ncbi:MAG: malate synthase A [Acidimicrobiia bacterium]|nr:malate synthase A [Acidimicrobiia bacterium]
MDRGVTITGSIAAGYDKILTDEALAFIAGLHRRFDPVRRELLDARAERQRRIDGGEMPDFLDATADIRAAAWTVAPIPIDLADRRCEITGPVDRKMMINALNSGARVFMADFEDSCSPTWSNLIEGQINLVDAVRRTIEHTAPDGRHYTLSDIPATLLVRPRGWHLVDNNVLIDGIPVSAALLDFGLFFFHNAAELVAAGSGPYFYLPKLESHLEARLWNDVFVAAQDGIGLPQGTIRATVLIETILAAFEMDEILYELRDHSAGLNAGRWDYIFSIIKKFRNRPDMVLPDRNQVTMAVPFMRAYTDLLIATCHRRRAHAMGGMAAFIPSRTDETVNAEAFAKVRHDKERESRNGHDGTWVAHPDLVSLATEVFDEVLGNRPNQIDRQRPDVVPEAAALLDVAIAGGMVTVAGVRINVDVAIRYLSAWLSGNGAAGIYNLMEDAATAEISRSQIWQWVHHGVSTEDGDLVDAAYVRSVADSEVARMRDEFGEDRFAQWRVEEARSLFEQVALDPVYPEFLTVPAYAVLETRSPT